MHLLPPAKVLGSGLGPKPSAFGDIELGLFGTVIAYLSATAAGLVFFAFLVRRRSASDPAPLTVAFATAAASPASAADERRVTPLPPMRDLIPPVNPHLLDVEEAPGPLASEAALPRWLRPSVRSGRRTRNPNRLSGRDD